MESGTRRYQPKCMEEEWVLALWNKSTKGELERQCRDLGTDVCLWLTWFDS